MSPWGTRRGRDGGVDRVPTPVGSGELWLCGKHAIGPDPDGLVAELGGATVVCLSRPDELVDRYPDYVSWLGARHGGDAVWWPIHDLHAPPVEIALPFVDGLVQRLVDGERLVIHCGAGIGRAGTIAVCILIRFGSGAEAAERTVAEHRPMAGPEAGPQRDLIDEVAVRGARSR